MEEEEEVERKLRIREIEGMIVVELIEMEEKRKNRDVEKKMKEWMKDERERIKVGRI